MTGLLTDIVWAFGVIGVVWTLVVVVFFCAALIINAVVG